MNQTVKYITGRLLSQYEEPEARALALWVAEEATGLSRSEILCKDTLNIPNIEIILSHLLLYEPVQYIFSHTHWAGLDLQLNSSTLIPRPETAELADWIIKDNSTEATLKVLDIGTGSGCIAILLKYKCPQWKVHALDISTAALQIAKENSIKNNTDVSFFQCDILTQPITEKYDIIVSNPPYITQSEKKDIARNVLNFEPHSALFVEDNDPLLFYRTISSFKAAKKLYFEINSRFAQQTKDMLACLGYKNIELKKDIYNNFRMICAQL